MEGEIWYKCSCGNCGKVNWIYSGYFPDPDLSKLDVDCFKCWNCEFEQSLIEEDFFNYMVDGKELPI